ncbi:hypothetical protein M2137_001902 [Parabacteroides sp. PFB2-10]|uniref:3-keto-disaccharide hydrolase n=1 Tax=Parabacteroides sp. PFB2-10 TaxID=1742405 RepID=UPI002475C4F1|nr:DUF1080 domain-containing protein [Parabacteroides sp. PFB2-10]MDH6313115.1 hypothetical protein [Parabacteroides sp. PFB2-10]MDL2244097.1 DUF1080 domain-containing protein [Parabacteroides sp. OttesenSCG-928-J18]
MMKYCFRTALLCGCLLITTQAFSQIKNKWIPLFGENLSEAQYDPEGWYEANGILTATKDKVIWTTIEYENFEIDLNFKNDRGTNSGVVVYCTDTTNWIPNSVEVQIADDHYSRWADAQPFERCGAIYGHLGPHINKVVKKPGAWNHLRIRCSGQHITVVLNGKKVTNMNMALWTSGTENPDGSEIPSWLPNPLADKPTKGYIGLQGKHGSASISFKNIKIRSTDPDGFPAPVVEEKTEEVQPEEWQMNGQQGIGL